ncbi:putative structural constituent of cuticle [Ixodes scapularis]
MKTTFSFALLLKVTVVSALLLLASADDGNAEDTLDTEGHSFGGLAQATTFRQASGSAPVNFLQSATSYSGASTYGQSAGLDRPQPFDFGYNVQDEFGNTQFRQEKGDESGSVQGSYGYTDALGVYRKVHYVADQNGFRADIKSNEPGVKQENPADVQLVVEPPPSGVQAATASRSGAFLHGGGGGHHAAERPARQRFPPGLHA